MRTMTLELHLDHCGWRERAIIATARWFDVTVVLNYGPPMISSKTYKIFLDDLKRDLDA